MKKIIFLTLAVSFLSSVLFATQTFALNIKRVSEVSIDTSIVREDVNFNQPERVVVVPVYPATSELNVREEEWFRGIYYYTVDILGFNDIPFHYLITKSGQVYEGNSGGDEREISINGIGNDMVLIGYMTNRFATSFDARAEDDLRDLVLNIMNQNQINPENLEVRGMVFERNEETRSVSMREADLFGTWQTDIDSFEDYLIENYNPQDKEYNIRIDEVILPQQAVSPGEIINLEMTVTNLSEYGLYAESSSEIIATREGQARSDFFINNEWFSISEFPVMGEDELLMPNQSATFDFQVFVPLRQGLYSETFRLVNARGSSLTNESFDISLEILPSDRPIIEITNTETGTLNVREIASGAADIIRQVSPGQRFFVVGDAGNGWLQIELGDGTTGWISQIYANRI